MGCSQKNGGIKNMIEIEGRMNPALIESPNGGWYVVAGGAWIPVPEGTRLSDINWVNNPQKSPALGASSYTKEVKGSKGDTYTVEVWSDGRTACNCMGFLYRRKCKHALALKGKV
ncbi:hypothetical protein CL629_02175 [bacterium]|nr:hypothetical protein [bacterium]